MKLYDIVSAMGDAVRLIGNDQAEITRLDTDSRRVKDGSLFFCIHGLRVDAHDFAPGAVKAGAAMPIAWCEIENVTRATFAVLKAVKSGESEAV